AFPTVSPAPDWGAAVLPIQALLSAPPAQGLELYFERSPTVYDGRFANNAWLMELPHPATKQCWGNALLVSRATADELGVTTEQVVELKASGRTVRAPVLVLAGHADGAVTLSLGFGQSTDGIAD